MLARAEELFSAAQSPMACADAGCCSRVVALAAGLSACGEAGSRQRSGFSGKSQLFPAKHWQGLPRHAGLGGPWQQAGALGISRALHAGQAKIEDGSGAGMVAF